MPEIDRLLTPELIAAAEGLDIRVGLLLKGLFAGLRLSRRKGTSIEWSGHREYIRGDDPSLIDWKLFARTDRFYVKEFHAETNLRCHLVLDATRSMDFTSGPPLTKFAYGVVLAAAFGWYLAENQDRVGLAVLGDDLDTYMPPSARKAAVSRMMTTMAELKPEGSGDLARALGGLASRLSRQGLCVVVSDLLDDPDAVVEAFRRLRSARQEVVVFHVLDPVEIKFDFREPGVFRDPETGLEVDADPRRTGPKYRDKLSGISERFRREFSSEGTDYVLVDTSRPFMEPLAEFVKKRGRGN